MDVFKVVGFTILALVLVVTLKQQRKEIAILLSIVSGIMILFSVIGPLSNIIDMLNGLIDKSGLSSKYLEIILKITAIAYIIEFSKNVCIDAGESAIATKVEIAGKVIVVSLSMPVILSVVEVVSKFVK